MDIKEEMREIIQNETEFEKISLPLSDYKKYLVEEHELFLNDKLYDVARIEINNDRVIFYCIHDSDEQELLTSLDVIFENAEETNNESSETQLLNFLNISSIFHLLNSLVKNSIYLASIKEFTPALLSQFLTPNTLPPKNNLFA